MTSNRLYRTALALIGLWVVIDAHSVPGVLIPLAALTAAGLAPPRWWAAGLAGFFGLVAGVDAVYYERPIGFLSLAAGITLLGLAGMLWWRTGRRVLKAAGALVLAAVVLFPIGVGWVLTHVARKDDRTVGTPVQVTAKIHGRFVPSRNGAAIVLIGRDEHARMLARHGYGVLAIDRRGEGRSGGQPNIWGWGNDDDIKSAIAWLERRGIDRIGGLGLSVGGEMMLQTAAETRGLDAVVSEGAGARSAREELQQDMAWHERPLTALSYGVRDLTAMISTGHTPPAPLSTLVPKIKRPVFLIAAPNSPNGERANRRFGAPLWELPESGHVGGIAARPAEYERRVVGFFDRSL